MEGLAPPASRSTVGCKPGHDSPWTLLRDLQPSMERATPPASRSTVGCKPGHDHRNVRDRIGRDQLTRVGEEKSQSDSPFLWLPFLLGIPASRLQQRIQGIRRRTWGVRGSYAGVRGAYAVRGFDSHDFFEGRFFVGFVEVFAVVEEQVKVFSFLDRNERKVFRKASCCLVSSGMVSTRSSLSGRKSGHGQGVAEGLSF